MSTDNIQQKPGRKDGGSLHMQRDERTRFCTGTSVKSDVRELEGAGRQNGRMTSKRAAG